MSERYMQDTAIVFFILAEEIANRFLQQQQQSLQQYSHQWIAVCSTI